MTDANVDALLDSLKEELENEPVRVDDDLRVKLLELSKSGEIKKTESQIKKASKATLAKMFLEYENTKKQLITEGITDKFVTLYCKALGYFELVENPDDLKEDLLRNELCMTELNRIVGWVSPYIPFAGLMSGAITTSGHVYLKKHAKD